MMLHEGGKVVDWAEVREDLVSKTAALENALEKATTAIEKVDLLIALAERLRVSDITRTAALLNQARNLAASVDYREGLASSLADLARYSLGLSNMDEATQLCYQAIEALADYPPTAALAKVYLNLGWIYDYLGDYSAALDWGLKGLEIIRPLHGEQAARNVVHTHVRLLDLIASIYSQMEDHSTAQQFHADAAKMSRSTGDLLLCASVFNNRAMTLLYAGEFEAALESGMACLELGRNLEMLHQVYNFADTVGEILIAMGRLEQAEQVLNEAGEMTRTIPFDISHGYVLRNLGRVNMARGNLDAAAGYLQKAIETMGSINVRGELAVCHQLMSEIHERQGNFSGALEHFKTYYKLREATTGKEIARRMAALKTGYDIQLAQRDAEIEHLRNVELQAEIEERRNVQAVLEMLATTDTLTNLANRHHFFVMAEREVERSLRYNDPLSMLILDIDYFKRVNDTLGHIAGDQVLAAIGRVIRSVLREVDIAGRYGGEEFAIMLPETPAENAVRASERLRNAIAELAVDTDAGRVSVTVSIGISGLAENEQILTHDRAAARELAAMLDRADRALYVAKRSGRNMSQLYISD